MSELGKKFDTVPDQESQSASETGRPQLAKILERLEHIERKLDILLQKSDSGGGGSRPFRSDRGPRREFGGGGFRGGRDRGPRREFGGGGGRDRGFRPDRGGERGERSGNTEGRGGNENRGNEERGEGRGGAEPWKERYKPFFDKKKPFFGDKKKRHRPSH